MLSTILQVNKQNHLPRSLPRPWTRSGRNTAGDAVERQLEREDNDPELRLPDKPSLVIIVLTNIFSQVCFSILSDERTY